MRGQATVADKRGLERFGDALQRARVAREMSQSELAQEAGVTQSNVSAWEGGRWAPPTEAVFELERVLRVAPGYLSRELGFLPLDGKSHACSVEEAVIADELLDGPARTVILTAYRELARRPQPRRRR